MFFTTKEKTEERLKICKSCEHRNTPSEDKLGRCGLCHCFIIAKTKLEMAKCPIDKW